MSRRVLVRAAHPAPLAALTGWGVPLSAAPPARAAPLTGVLPEDPAPGETADACEQASRPADRHGVVAVRRLGLVGALLMAVGALGAGALPVPNPLAGLRLLGLPARNPTLSVAVTYTGMVLLVVAWWRVERLVRRHPGDLRRAALVRLGLTWAVPLAVAPPLFSRDVYSYLAQGAILGHGLDPYRLGPAAALGIDHPLTRGVPALWRVTPSPYGPLFLLVSRGLEAVTGDHVVAGVVAQRGVALAGLALVCWALPRLARRFGADADHALWLGAANPLVLFHVVSGAHNEGLTVGLMLVGLEIGLRARTPRPGPRLFLGAAVVVAASAVKLPALLALGYLGTVWARRRGGRPADVAVAACCLAAVAVAGYLPLTAILGPGWMVAPMRPTGVLSPLSAPTDLGVVVGWVGMTAGLGDHTGTALLVLGTSGAVVAGLVVAATLVSTVRTDRNVLALLATGLTAVALLAAPTQPWYLLWALAPLAATRLRSRQLDRVTAGVLALALVLPPTGTDFVSRGYQLVAAIAAAVVMLAATLVAHHLPRPRSPGGRLRATHPRGPERTHARRGNEVTAAGPPGPIEPRRATSAAVWRTCGARAGPGR